MLSLTPVPAAPPLTPLNHTSATSTIILPTLETQPDERFLRLTSTLAGRAVLIELYAPPGSDRNTRERTWWLRRHQVNMAELGRAAQALERAKINWRQARDYREILAVLPPAPVN
jgi:hypothetical protein